MKTHSKYIFETCEYCADWTRPTDASGNADYIRHVLENHLWTAAISEGDRVKFIDPPAGRFGLLGTVSRIEDDQVYVNWDNGQPAHHDKRRLVRADAVPVAPLPNPQPIHDGVAWHIKVRDDGLYCIDIFRMAYNYRIVLSDPDHMMYAHGWCYFGHGHNANGSTRTMEDARLAAFAAAAVWDGYGSPPGYDKQAC